MKNILLYLAILPVFFISCNTEENTEGEREFAPGELNIGIVETAGITEAWDLVNSFDLFITDAWGHKYLSNLPVDSMDYIVNYLNGRLYINDNFSWKAVKDGNVKIDKETNKISVSCRILNVTIKTQTEWLTDVKELELYEVPVATKVFYLEVPVDYELEWKAIFEHEEIIEWASPNYYYEIIYN